MLEPEGPLIPHACSVSGFQAVAVHHEFAAGNVKPRTAPLVQFVVDGLDSVEATRMESRALANGESALFLVG